MVAPVDWWTQNFVETVGEKVSSFRLTQCQAHRLMLLIAKYSLNLWYNY